MSVLVAPQGQRALIQGDVLIHPTQVTEEHWTRIFDGDPALAALTRYKMLDELEARLEGQSSGSYLFGDRLTETDLRAFVTLIRFDAAYHGLFKTNRRQIADYPRLQDYMERIYRLPGVSATVNMDHITCGYYSIKALNPKGIRPTGPSHIEALVA